MKNLLKEKTMKWRRLVLYIYSSRKVERYSYIPKLLVLSMKSQAPRLVPSIGVFLYRWGEITTRSENFRFRLGLGFCSTGLSWVSVFIFRKNRFSVGFWVFPRASQRLNFLLEISLCPEKF
jgi:hypothetical protein